MKIYTKTGDSGETSLFAGGRVRKSNPRVDAYGTVDELNSLCGLVRSYPLPEKAQIWLEKIQNDLFIVGADLATPNGENPAWLVRLNTDPIVELEHNIDMMDSELTPLKSFILPGGTTPAATLHVARAVCRRAERACVALADELQVNPAVLIYLNRLSDFLFTLARWVNHKAGEPETKWSVRS